MRSIKVFLYTLFFLSLCSCVPDEVILNGNISGYVADSETRPLQEATIKLIASNDSTITGPDGSYLFTNKRPNDYEIQALKPNYDTVTRIAIVEPASNTNVNFFLTRLPNPIISDIYIDFGLSSTLMSFTISNAGKGEFEYYITSSKGWITVHPVLGKITSETDTIIVSIDKTGLSEKKQEETITITAAVGKKIRVDKVGVLVNGILDQEEHYYGVTTIGTQTWMAENLNTGTMRPRPVIDWGNPLQNDRCTDDQIVEKYCYYENEYNCEIYGGLYEWREMMDYTPQDDGIIGTTQGICPDGWHIPTKIEWETLIDYLGGPLVAGGKLKATGIFDEGTGFWLSPNSDASDEYGFSALPGGMFEWPYFGADPEYEMIQEGSVFRMAEWGKIQIVNNSSEIQTEYVIEKPFAASVRCIKDP